MIARLLLPELQKLMQVFPAVALLGARQVGKTTLSKQLIPDESQSFLYLDAERESDQFRLKNAESYLQQHSHKTIIIDEVQQIPTLFTALRPLIDAERRPGRFLLLGSASPRLVKGVSESLAGRIAYSYLDPINLLEIDGRKDISLIRHWFRGGFPEALLADNDENSKVWLSNFIFSFVEQDLESLFHINFPKSTVNNFWQMLASSSGRIWNGADFSKALGVSSPTATKFLDYLEAAFMIYKLPAWFVNIGKRVIKSPKIYIRDSGILHRLARLNNWEDLQANLLIGASWEGYVIEQIRQLKNNDLDLYYYRTQNGAECDALLVRGTRPISSIEIKYSNAPQLSKGFYNAVDDVKTSKNFVITPMADPFYLNPSTKVTNIKHFLQEELVQI